MSCDAHNVRNSGPSVDNSPHELSQVPVIGMTTYFSTEQRCGDGGAGVPVYKTPEYEVHGPVDYLR